MEQLGLFGKIVERAPMTPAEAGRLGAYASKEPQRRLFRLKVEKYNAAPSLCAICRKPLTYRQNKKGARCCCHRCAATLQNGRPHVPRPNCLVCGKKINKGGRTYCSLKCQAVRRQDEYLEKWKSGWNPQSKSKTLQVRQWMRRLLIRVHGEKCTECGWSKMHPVTGRVPLEVHHRDADAANNRMENLQLLCPNCHALTPTFRALNRNSKRNRKPSCRWASNPHTP